MAWTSKWNIWIASTNNNIITNADSEILVADLPEALQEVSEPNWMKIPVIHIRDNESPLENTTNNGILINSKAIILTLEIGTKYFVFPEDVSDYKALLLLLRKRWLLICRDGFEQDEDTKYPLEFHSDDKALLCSVSDRDASHNSDAGIIDYNFTLQRQKPVYSE